MGIIRLDIQMNSVVREKFGVPCLTERITRYQNWRGHLLRMETIESQNYLSNILQLDVEDKAHQNIGETIKIISSRLLSQAIGPYTELLMMMVIVIFERRV